MQTSTRFTRIISFLFLLLPVIALQFIAISGAQINLSKYKIVMFDHGIYQRIMGLDLPEYSLADSFSAINKGNIAEQFAGTEMIKYVNPGTRNNLFYWHRETQG